MSINFSELVKKAEAAGFSLIPDGPYTCAIESAEATQSTTNKPMIKVRLVVADGPSRGRKLFTQHTLTIDNDNALRFFFEAMTAYGFPKEYWSSPEASLAHVAAQLPNRRVTAEVGHKTYQGQERNEVKSVKAIVGGAPMPATSVPGPGPAPIPAAAPSPQPIQPAQSGPEPF